MPFSCGAPRSRAWLDELPAKSRLETIGVLALGKAPYVEVLAIAIERMATRTETQFVAEEVHRVVAISQLNRASSAT